MYQIPDELLYAQTGNQILRRREGRENMRPIIGISMGDPYGNGPEVSVKALNHPDLYERCAPLIVGDAVPMRYALKVAELVSGIRLRLNVITDIRDAKFTYGTIDVLNLGMIGEEDYPKIPACREECGILGIGSTAKGGDAGFSYVVKVIQLCMAGEIRATVTNAISKEAINMAGHHYSGHTEIYADYTGTKKYGMMLAHDNLRVIHVSTHVSLREACDRVKKDRVLECIHLADRALKDLGFPNPKIGVAGLNPHCGEGGLFGREEIEERSSRLLTRRLRKASIFRIKSPARRIRCFQKPWAAGMT